MFETERDFTFYGTWNTIPYTITYVDPMSVTNSNVTTYNIETDDITLINLEKAGYTFGGWYDNQELSGTPVTQISKGSLGNKTFYAKWLQNYTITYVDPYGASNPNPLQYNQETATFTLLALEKAGYIFIGWTNAQDEPITEIIVGSAGDITLTANWSVENYTITYVDPMNVVNPNEDTYNIESDDIELPTLSKEGYIFEGWFADDEFNTPADPITTGTTGDKTFYAKWSLINYNITYHLDDGTNGSNPTIYTIETNDITLADASKEGYAFSGWYTEPEFINTIDTIDTSTLLDYDLYAKWDVVEYTLTYEMRMDSTNAESNPATYNIESGEIILQAPTKYSHTFQGWYTDASFTHQITSIVAGSAGNKTLYAKWNYDGTFKYNGTAISGLINANTSIVEIPGEIIKNGVWETNIGVIYGFRTNTNITSVKISKYVWTIDSNAFQECTNLTYLQIDSVSQAEADEGKGLNIIKTGAFAGCTKLKGDANGYLKIPESVDEIGALAFVSCAGVITLDLPNSLVTLSHNGSGLYQNFHSMTNLDRLIIGTGLTTIPMEAFASCVNLTTIEFRDVNNSTLKTISTSAFINCNSLVNLQLNEGLETIGENAFMHSFALGDVYIPASVTSIGGGAFYVDSVERGINFTFGCDGIDGTAPSSTIGITTGNLWNHIPDVVSDSQAKHTYTYNMNRDGTKKS